MPHDPRFQSGQSPLPFLLPLVIMIGRGRDAADKQAAKKHDGDPPPDSPMPAWCPTQPVAHGAPVNMVGETVASAKSAEKSASARPASQLSSEPTSASETRTTTTAARQTSC